MEQQQGPQQNRTPSDNGQRRIRVGDFLLYQYSKDDHPGLVGETRPCIVLGLSKPNDSDPDRHGYDVHIFTKGRKDFVDYGWDSSGGPLIKEFVFLGDEPGQMQFRK